MHTEQTSPSVSESRSWRLDGGLDWFLDTFFCSSQLAPVTKLPERGFIVSQTFCTSIGWARYRLDLRSWHIWLYSWADSFPWHLSFCCSRHAGCPVIAALPYIVFHGRQRDVVVRPCCPSPSRAYHATLWSNAAHCRRESPSIAYADFPVDGNFSVRDWLRAASPVESEFRIHVQT